MVGHRAYGDVAPGFDVGYNGGKRPREGFCFRLITYRKDLTIGPQIDTTGLGGGNRRIRRFFDIVKPT